MLDKKKVNNNTSKTLMK